MLSCKITKIEKQAKRDRYNIYLDGNYGFSVSSHILAVIGLGENQNITEKQIEDFKNIEQENKAFNRAILILSYRANTEKELRTKLIKNFDEAILDKVMFKLKGQGLINDTDFADRYMEQSKKGKRLVGLELLKKGIDKETIEKIGKNRSNDTEIENASKIAEKLLKKYEKSDIQTQKTKVYENLIRKGFSYDVFKDIWKDKVK